MAVGLVLALASYVAPGADEAHPISFRIKDGPAEATLRSFAEQSGVQVVYPAQLVENVRTHEIDGTFTARAALDRMLAGTALSVWQDERTGALAIGRAGTEIRPIELPPFVVEATTDASRKWRYARAPGIDVLSRCSDEVTIDLIAQNYALHALLEILLPKPLQARSDLPTSFLFFSDGGQSAGSSEILATLQRRELEVVASQPTAHGKPGVQVTIGAMPNYRFWDQDALSIFFVWQEIDFNRGRLMITPSYVRYLMENRYPALPRWFVEGLMELYRTVTMNTAPLRPYGPSFGGPVSTEPQSLFASPFSDRPQLFSLSLRPVTWISDEVTQELRMHPRAQADLIPFETLFAEHPLAGEDKDFALKWRSEAALFIRWMLDGGGEARRQALWRWVERASAGPVDMADFKECVGVNASTAELELQDYLRVALGTSMTLRPARTPEPVAVQLSDATEPEVSRIKGGFNRLEIAYVREVCPQLTGKYIEQARRTLRRAYDAGERDPRLLAELGLCECDAGNDAGAVPFLEAAVQGKVVRPRAYYELARIRFASLRPATTSGSLSADQLASVLKPLYLVRGQTPALGEAYDLMAEAWLRSTGSPTAEQLQLLREGVRQFPRRTRLIFSVALLHAGHGHPDEAQALITQGLAVTNNETERARFLKLETMIAVNRATAK